MQYFRKFLWDLLFAVVGMFVGAVAGYLIVCFYCGQQFPRSLRDTSAGFGAVCGAAVCGIIGANLRTWYERLVGATQARESPRKASHGESDKPL